MKINNQPYRTDGPKSREGLVAPSGDKARRARLDAPRTTGSSQSHVSHCRVLPLGEFTVMVPEPHAKLQGVRIQSGILKIVFRHMSFYVFNAV